MQDSDNGAPLSRTQDKPDMTISSLCSRDIPGVYIPYGVGIAIVLTIERLYPDYFTRARFEETRRVFKEHYDHWLDPNNANGIAALVAATTTEVNNRRWPSEEFTFDSYEPV